MNTTVQTQARLPLALLMVVLCSWFATGCAIRGNGKGIAYGVDAATILMGAAIVADTSVPSSPSCASSNNTYVAGCLGSKAGIYAGTKMLGTGMILAGVTGLLINMVINSGDDNENFTYVGPTVVPLVINSTPSPVLPAVVQPLTPIVVATAQKEAPPHECQVVFSQLKIEKDNYRRYDIIQSMSPTCLTVFVNM